jgi:signal transduction histidine kinase
MVLRNFVANAAKYSPPGTPISVRVSTDDGTAVLAGTTVKLKQEAADLLTQTFGTDALKAGFVIGIAKITVNTA